MDASTDNNASPTPAPPTDSGLRCPQCDYNLTGVAENRCPECGALFDPERLRAILAGAIEPIPVWDDLRRNVISRFVVVCLTTWFAPWRIGRSFPRCYDQTRATTFRWLVVPVPVVVCLTIILIYAAATGRDLPPQAMAPFMLLGTCVLVGVAICEAI